MRWLVLIIILFSLNGCISTAVKDAIDTADEHVRLKWSEEWKPDIKKEIAKEAKLAKDEALKKVITRIEKYEESNKKKFEKLQVDPKDHDRNDDGKLQFTEALTLYQELNAKNKAAGNPFSWWEIILLVIAGYIPTTAGKEYLKNKMSKSPISG